MEMSQGNSLCSYLKETKMSFLFPLQNQRAEGLNRSCLVSIALVWRGRRWRKDVGGQIWCKYCVHMYVNGKLIPVKTLLWMGRGRRKWKRMVEGVNSSLIYLICCKNLCKCHNVPPTQHNNKKQKQYRIVYKK
jgi:hypothetical protein